MKKIKTRLDNFIEKRVIENKNLFTSKELKKIKRNKILIKKIYLLAIHDYNDINKKNQIAFKGEIQFNKQKINI